MFVSNETGFLNPNDQPLNVDLSAPGLYDFGIVLSGPYNRDLSTYRFSLWFDEMLAPAISVVGSLDTTGGSPQYTGITTYMPGMGAITLTNLRLSTFGGTDTVGNYDTNPDGALDFVGSFQLSVASAVPEPSSMSMIGMGLIGALGIGLKRHFARENRRANLAS
jgi:hypothetical protein